jgi:hypothetical protein
MGEYSQVPQLCGRQLTRSQVFKSGRHTKMFGGISKVLFHGYRRKWKAKRGASPRSAQNRLGGGWKANTGQLAGVSGGSLHQNQERRVWGASTGCQLVHGAECTVYTVCITNCRAESRSGSGALEPRTRQASQCHTPVRPRQIPEEQPDFNFAVQPYSTAFWQVSSSWGPLIQRLRHLNKDPPLSRRHEHLICTYTVRLWTIPKWGCAENWVIQVKGTPLPNDNMAVSNQLAMTNLYPRNWPCLHRQAVPRNAYHTVPTHPAAGPGHVCRARICHLPPTEPRVSPGLSRKADAVIDPVSAPGHRPC